MPAWLSVSFAVSVTKNHLHGNQQNHLYYKLMSRAVLPTFLTWQTNCEILQHVTKPKLVPMDHLNIHNIEGCLKEIYPCISHNQMLTFWPPSQLVTLDAHKRCKNPNTKKSDLSCPNIDVYLFFTQSHPGYPIVQMQRRSICVFLFSKGSNLRSNYFIFFKPSWMK